MTTSISSSNYSNESSIDNNNANNSNNDNTNNTTIINKRNESTSNVRNVSNVHASNNNKTNNNNNSVGLIVTAKQMYYPIELSNSELLSHYETVQEYQLDIASNIIQQSSKCNPSTKLINQQPEVNPLTTRNFIIGFLYKLAHATRVTNGIFFQSVRLFDRYCSKRIVLKDQVHLILGTCLWLAAKTYGGCNHIINNIVVPTGGRFYGPNPRARIPRLNELVYYCSQNNKQINLDESMFLQMEKHILDTLNWEVYEPMLNDYVLNVDENCLIQYELYQRQAEANNNEIDNELNDKIQLIQLKKFLMDLTCWQFELLNFELFEITFTIFQLINKFTNENDQSSLLDLPQPNSIKQSKIFSIFINAIVDAPNSLLENYQDFPSVLQFINNIKMYILQATQQQQQQQHQVSKISLNTTLYDNSTTSSPQSIPSPVYSQHSSTPLRNISGYSENSIFSNMMDNNSPITPSMYSNKNNNNWGSALSIDSNKRNYNNVDCNGSNVNNMIDKENIIPPRSKFLNTGITSSHSSNSSRTSLISLTVNQTT